MIIEAPFEIGQPRRNVWCSLSELTNNDDGTYSFTTLPDESLGFGSKVYIVDSPDLELYFDNTTGLLYPWNKLPHASDTILGMVKVGEGLYIDSDGVLSVSNTGQLYVGKATETIAAGYTTKTVNFTGNFLGAFATVDGEQILVDLTIGETSVVFTIASAITSDILCTVVYGTESNE